MKLIPLLILGVIVIAILPVSGLTLDSVNIELQKNYDANISIAYTLSTDERAIVDLVKDPGKLVEKYFPMKLNSHKIGYISYTLPGFAKKVTREGKEAMLVMGMDFRNFDPSNFNIPGEISGLNMLSMFTPDYSPGTIKVTWPDGFSVTYNNVEITPYMYHINEYVKK